jgi:hypothetical protein
MSSLKLSIITSLLAATLTAGSFYHFHSKKAREADYLRYKNNQILFEAYQRHQAKTTEATPDPSAIAASTVSTPVTTNQKAVENYRNAGQATPLATLQTFAWACDRGDTETVAKMICFDLAAQTKAEAFMASLPEAERSQWKSVDDMAATQLTFEGMASPYPNADVLDAAVIEQLGKDRAEFRLPGIRKDRTTFQKKGDLWKVVVTEAMVDAYTKQTAKLPASR